MYKHSALFFFVLLFLVSCVSSFRHVDMRMAELTAGSSDMPVLKETIEEEPVGKPVGEEVSVPGALDESQETLQAEIPQNDATGDVPPDEPEPALYEIDEPPVIVEEEAEPAVVEAETLRTESEPAAEQPVAESETGIAADDAPVHDTDDDVASKPDSESKTDDIPARVMAGKTVSFMFLPTVGADFDSAALSVALPDYADCFSSDIVVITGQRALLLNLLTNFSNYRYPLVFDDSVLLTNREILRSRIVNESYAEVEFEDLTVRIYVNRKDRKPDDGLSGTAGKPVLVFACPGEPSYYDRFMMAPGLDKDRDYYAVDYPFVYGMEKDGFVDLYDSVRYSAETIGLAHPGFTVSDATGSERVDFVLAKDMIAESVSQLYVHGLSDLKGVKRFGIRGIAAY